MLTRDELRRYSRHILIPAFGQEGQEKLKQSRVLVIGAGGLGSPALFYLAAAGVGTIGILDFDTVDESNLQRQILYTSGDIGQLKTEKARERLNQLNPLINYIVHTCALSTGNAMEIMEGYDVIIDGSDNLPTRYMVNDACVFLKKTLIYGAIFQFEGQVSVFNQLLSDGTRGPNYRDLFPEPPPPDMVPSCSTGGVLGVLPGIIGAMQANEAIKIMSGIGTTLSGRLMLFDSLDFSTRYIHIRKDPDNPVSGINPTIKNLIDYEQFCNPVKHKIISVNDIGPEGLKALMASSPEVYIIDVREKTEYDWSNIGGKNIPLKDIDRDLSLVPREGTVIVLCKSGQRSRMAVEKLIAHGFDNLLNLKGGLLQWRDDVQPDLDVY